MAANGAEGPTTSGWTISNVHLLVYYLFAVKTLIDLFHVMSAALIHNLLSHQGAVVLSGNENKVKENKMKKANSVRCSYLFYSAFLKLQGTQRPLSIDSSRNE